MAAMLFAMRPINPTTVCIPARNEAGTIGQVVSRILGAREIRPDLIEEVVVVDDRSTDRTAQIARAAGARVLTTDDACGAFGGSQGKGDAIWTALRHCSTELVAFVDADVTEIAADFVARLVDPLLRSPSLQLAKGRFTRLGAETAQDRDGRGASGRVTTLTARPLLSLLHPDLGHIREPLGGVFAGRVEVLGSLRLDRDYGVDVGILLDVVDQFGPASVVEIDLGVLGHRRRSLDSLAVTAEQVARAILTRATAATPIADDIATRRTPPRARVLGGRR